MPSMLLRRLTRTLGLTVLCAIPFACGGSEERLERTNLNLPRDKPEHKRGMYLYHPSDFPLPEREVRARSSRHSKEVPRAIEEP